MCDMFGDNNVQKSSDHTIRIAMDNCMATLDPFALVSYCCVSKLCESVIYLQNVECEDEALQHQVLTAAKRLHTALS